MVKVTWTTKYMGDFHAFKEPGEVEGFCAQLRALGFTPRVGREA